MIISWIPQIRLPTETQQTPNKAPKRLQPGLDLDTSFEDLMDTYLFDFFCQKANLI